MGRAHGPSMLVTGISYPFLRPLIINGLARKGGKKLMGYRAELKQSCELPMGGRLVIFTSDPITETNGLVGFNFP